MKAYYRTADGHTYWCDNDGEVVGAPTLKCGGVDISQAGYVVDFDLETRDRVSLILEVRAALDDPMTAVELFKLVDGKDLRGAGP